MRQYGYKFAGYFMEYGPVEALDLEEARLRIRTRLNVARLPKGLHIWDLEERALARWRVAQAS